MSDKPLDCVGVTGGIGKHDFKEHKPPSIKDLYEHQYDCKIVGEVHRDGVEVRDKTGRFVAKIYPTTTDSGLKGIIEGSNDD